MPPRDKETPNTAGFSGFWKSIELENCSASMPSMKCLYTELALKPEVIVPVNMPSKNFTRNPAAVSLKPSPLPLRSVNRERRLLGRPIYPTVKVSFLASG